MVSREHTRPLAETYTRLVTVAAELVEHAEVEGEDATVPRYLIRRLEREVRGRPQPQKLSWMSVE